MLLCGFFSDFLFFCSRVLWLPTSKIQTENFSVNSFLPQQHLDSWAPHGYCTIHELYKMILRWVCADHAVAPPAASQIFTSPAAATNVIRLSRMEVTRDGNADWLVSLEFEPGPGAAACVIVTPMVAVMSMTAAAVATTAVLLFTPILLKAMITTNTGKKFQKASSCLDLFDDSSQLLNTVWSCCRNKNLEKVLDSTDRSTTSYYSNRQDCDAEFRGVSRV